MDALSTEGIVQRDTTRFIEVVGPVGPVRVNLRGRVHTASGAILFVNKWLDVDASTGPVRVLTSLYDYHAVLRLPNGQRDLFRYDNSHGGVETLHCHRFDVEGNDCGRVDVEPERMPPLALVIRDAEFLASISMRA